MSRPDLSTGWHEAECHNYDADLDLWRALAAEEAGPILDIGAGTGRVALDLAAAGHDVVALDLDPDLLATLRSRVEPGTSVEVVLGDATDLPAVLPDRQFGLVLIPMQTIQLFRPAGRQRFWETIRASIAPGGLLALAIADPFEGTEDPDRTEPPLPDRLERDGWRFLSQPVAVRYDSEAGTVAIDRIRTLIAPDGSRTVESDTIALDVVTAAGLVEEAEALAGLAAEGLRAIPQTEDHVGSQVVVLRAP